MQHISKQWGTFHRSQLHLLTISLQNSVETNPREQLLEARTRLWTQGSLPAFRKHPSTATQPKAEQQISFFLFLQRSVFAQQQVWGHTWT